MKQHLCSLFLAASICLAASAQDPYFNNTLVNTSDIFGTSRFVSMGGAMGALGADISAISSNPAGIALISKNDVSLTAGASWLSNNSARGFADRTFAQFNQFGAVASFRLGGSVNNINLAFNYQKKIDYNNSFRGSTHTAASWSDQLNGLADEAWKYKGLIYEMPSDYDISMYGFADYVLLFGEAGDPIKKYSGDMNETWVVTRGSLSSYEINLSTNIKNRFFLGLTIGVDDVDFSREVEYNEERKSLKGDFQDFLYNNLQRVSGNGYNVKLGAIVRPFENNPFRVGLTVETPTWYDLKYIDDPRLTTHYEVLDETIIYDSQYLYDYYLNDYADGYVNYMEYKLNTPWKIRTQIGSTVGKIFAFGMEYEYARYSGTTMRLPQYYGGSTYDMDFKNATYDILKPQHTFRAGLEFKPLNSLSLRIGYNFISSTTREGAYWDPAMSNTTLAYPTGLDYMNLSDVNIITAGVGYRYKWLYADLAYKCRKQTGDYFPFNPEWSGMPASSCLIPVDLTKHTLTATIGVRF